MSKHIGSTFEDFLKEEGTYEETTAQAIKLSDFHEQAAEIARLKMEIAKLKAENLELSHTPNRLAEVEAERDYFQQEMQMARKEYEELANAILADERRK